MIIIITAVISTAPCFNGNGADSALDMVNNKIDIKS